MKKNFLEIFTGFIVILLAAIFTIFAYKQAELKTDSHSYNLKAKFSQADGIGIGSEIKIAGIKIGVVKHYELDINDYMAVIHLQIEDKIKIPNDSSAQIASESLLGGRYIAIVPGASDEILSQDGEIKYTQSSVNIENLIGKMIFGGDKK